jgi:hypothetical protein
MKIIWRVKQTVQNSDLDVKQLPSNRIYQCASPRDQAMGSAEGAPGGRGGEGRGGA